MSESKLNLFQRINKVREAINYIQKDKAVSAGASGSYKAVTHDTVTAMVRSHMVEHGIVSYPVLVNSESKPKEGDAKQFRYEATYDIFFVNSDNPEEKITLRIQAHAMDNADKAPGKALSYAKKYAVLKLFEIETGEDEESRYQDAETFNIEFWAETLKGSVNVEALQANYLQAKQDCIRLNDSASMKAINSLTAARKAELEKA
jgi:hypothetical protein